MAAQAAAGAGAAATSAASNIVSSLISKRGAKQANSQQIKSMHDRMAWEQMMSSTAHQREVNDLKAAGLNPVLSAQRSGASTPNVSGPTTLNPYAGFKAGGNSAIAARNAIKLTNATLKTEASKQLLNRKMAGFYAWQGVNQENQTAQTEHLAAAAKNDLKVENSFIGQHVLPWLRKFGLSGKNIPIPIPGKGGK